MTARAAGQGPMVSRPKQVAAVIIEAANTPFTALDAAHANAQSVPPLSGVLGQVKSVTPNSIEIGTKSGIESVEIKQPLTTYPQAFSHLRPDSSDSSACYALNE